MQIVQSDSGVSAGFNDSHLYGNFLIHDPWFFPHTYVPFCITFLSGSLQNAIIAAYSYESVIAIIHIIEQTHFRKNDGYNTQGYIYPYAGPISSLIQDPIQALLGALLGRYLFLKYRLPLQESPLGYLNLTLFVLLTAVTAILSEYIWDPPISTGFFTIPLLLIIYIYPELKDRDHHHRTYCHMTILVLINLLINLCCICTFVVFHFCSSQKVIKEHTLFGTLYEIDTKCAIGQCAVLWFLVWTPVFVYLIIPVIVGQI